MPLLELSGIEQIRERFIALLKVRQVDIAEHFLAAWDADSAEEITTNLAAAQVNLHRIAGTAGSLGFPELGDLAGQCENDIIAHLGGEMADVPVCPKELALSIGDFLAKSEELLRTQS